MSSCSDCGYENGVVCLPDFCGFIDADAEVARLRDANEQLCSANETLKNKLNKDSQTFQIACHKAEIDLIREKARMQVQTFETILSSDVTGEERQVMYDQAVAWHDEWAKSSE